MSELTTAVTTLVGRANEYLVAEGYYEGMVNEVMPFRLRRLASNNYRVNFCRTVVDAVLNRLEVNAIVGTTQAATALIGKVWENNELALEVDEIHRRALVYGDAYALVWPDEAGEMAISYHSPRTMTMVYDPENPRRKQYAAKMWLTKDVFGRTVTRVNLYYADRIEKYQADSEFADEHSTYRRLDTIENPFGEVPVFHFRTERPFGRPEHLDAYGLQDAITKAVATHMYTMDYQGAPQRYALSNSGENAESEDFQEDDTDRENVGALRNGPGELWYLKGVQSVGEFKPADPDTFLKPVAAFIKNMASLTNTPLHYFERTGNVPSGEALRTAEAPLLKKVSDRQLSFGATWRELFKYVLRVEGINADVTVHWEPAESMDSLATWDVMLKKINAGLSHRQALREGGYDEERIEEIMRERQEEAQQGLYYQRAPQTRVSTVDNENNAVEGA